MLGYTPPPRQVPPGRYTSEEGTPPWADIPRQVHTLWQVHQHLPGQDTPLGRYPQAGTLPLGRHHPPAQCMLGHTHTPAQCMLGYGQQAGGTHPTGMYSCLSYSPTLQAANMWQKVTEQDILDKQHFMYIFTVCHRKKGRCCVINDVYKFVNCASFSALRWK